MTQGGASRLGPSLATAAGRAGSERRPKLLGFTLRGARVGEPPPACPSSAPVPCREPWLAFRSLPHSAVDGGEEHEKPSRGDNRSQVDQKPVAASLTSACLIVRRLVYAARHLQLSPLSV